MSLPEGCEISSHDSVWRVKSLNSYCTSFPRPKKYHINWMIHNFQSPGEVCWQRHYEFMITVSFFCFQTNKCWRFLFLERATLAPLPSSIRVISTKQCCITLWGVLTSVNKKASSAKEICWGECFCLNGQNVLNCTLTDLVTHSFKRSLF